MTLLSRSTAPGQITYPENDGNPLSEHTLQFRWIVTIKEGLDALYADDPDVFVAGDLLWYPVEGDNKRWVAPDAMVVFGRPKGDRGSYQQWNEGGIAPQVVFEVLSPGNRAGEMIDKYIFYSRYAVNEYYQYDPFRNELRAWIRASRSDSLLEPVEDARHLVSPLMGVKFELPDDGELLIYRPDGTRFLTYGELDVARRIAEEPAGFAEERAFGSEQKAQRLAERLRELGIDPETI